MIFPNDKMSFKDYYRAISEIQAEIRAKICSELEISKATFYNKMKDSSFTRIEKEKIAQIMSGEVSQLFPEEHE